MFRATGDVRDDVMIPMFGEDSTTREYVMNDCPDRIPTP